MEDHDYKFIFGDLNFRIEMTYEETIEEINRRNYEGLRARD